MTAKPAAIGAGASQPAADMAVYMRGVGAAARAAARVMAAAPTATRSAALRAIVEALAGDRRALMAANAIDMTNAAGRGLDQPLVDRLLLDDDAIDRMIEGIGQVVAKTFQ